MSRYYLTTRPVAIGVGLGSSDNNNAMDLVPVRVDPVTADKNG